MKNIAIANELDQLAVDVRKTASEIELFAFAFEKIGNKEDSKTLRKLAQKAFTNAKNISLNAKKLR